MSSKSELNNNLNLSLEQMFQAGVHLGYRPTRRHPSTKPYILTTKNKTDIIDLEKTIEVLVRVSEFLKNAAQAGKQIIFVGTKPEAKKITKELALKLNMPYVIERWIGGTLTNFSEIKKRIDRLLELKEKKQKGQLEKYTKKERLLFDREINKLEKYFGGLIILKKTPDILLVIDSKHESIAVREAQKNKIPVISLSNTDNNITGLDYPVIGNDNSVLSIGFFMKAIEKAYSAA